MARLSQAVEGLATSHECGSTPPGRISVQYEDQDYENDDPFIRFAVPAQDLDFEEDDYFRAW